MKQQIILEDFSTAAQMLHKIVQNDDIQSSVREAYEKGYSEGWSECDRNHSENRIAENFALTRAAENMSRTLEDVQDHALEICKEVAEQFFEAALNILATDISLIPIFDMLEQHIRQHTADGIEVTVSPGAAGKIVAHLIHDRCGLRVKENIEVPEGEIWISKNQIEISSDIDQIIENFRDVINGAMIFSDMKRDM